jgi:lipopolysaccharide/colanic/teichoic acid biosynthesis glycosyltransferase
MTTTETFDPLRPSRATGLAGWARRSLTQAVAVLLLVLSLPLWLVVAALVRWRLGSPVFFTQPRVGLGGRVFVIRKFRTMLDACGPDGAALPDHERLTPLGRFLRRTRLDELPQLLAIADGSMAFIGPRPLLPKTIADLGALGTLRCQVRPGLTGWAQVNGNTALSNAEKIALDIWYIKNKSVWSDLAILFSTALVPLRGERVNSRNVARAEADLILRHQYFARGGSRP